MILKTEHQERGMLNHYKHWICEIPVTTVRVMNYKFKIYRNLTNADAKYVALVVRPFITSAYNLLQAGMAQSKACKDFKATLSNDLVAAVQEIARSHGRLLFFFKTPY